LNFLVSLQTIMHYGNHQVRYKKKIFIKLKNNYGQMGTEDKHISFDTNCRSQPNSLAAVSFK